jgi:hypothetical protein
MPSVAELPNGHLVLRPWRHEDSDEIGVAKIDAHVGRYRDASHWREGAWHRTCLDRHRTCAGDFHLRCISVALP